MPKGSYQNVTSVINEKLYPFIEEKLQSRYNQYKTMIQKFMNRNSKQLYDVAPYYNIYYKDTDKKEFFQSLDITEKQVNDIMKDCFYWNKPYNPGAAKEPYVVVLMCCIRYFLKNKKQLDAELSTIYMCFSGKFYASLYSNYFKKVAPGKYKTVMDFVINTMLTDKFDLKTQGSVFGAIRAMCITWLNTYKDNIISDLDDDEIGGLIQQIRGRENSFIKNIANKYYEAYDNRNYINTDHENLDINLGEFRLAENDSLKAARITESAMNYIINNSVSMTLCDNAQDSNVKSSELMTIMETIFANKDYFPDIKRVINILVCDFMKTHPKIRINSGSFFEYSVKAKPNTKDKYIIELHDIITNWLTEVSEDYRRRSKTRAATKNSYYNCVIKYITLIIMAAAGNE